MSSLLGGGGGSSSLVVGTTTITGGTNGKLLYDNNGILGEESLPPSLIEDTIVNILALTPTAKSSRLTPLILA